MCDKCSPRVWKCIINLSGILYAIFGLTLLVLTIVISKKDFAEASGMENLILGYGAAFGSAILLIGITGWLASRNENYCLVVIVSYIRC